MHPRGRTLPGCVNSGKSLGRAVGRRAAPARRRRPPTRCLQLHFPRGCSSAGRAAALQAVGRGFESLHLHRCQRSRTKCGRAASSSSAAACAPGRPMRPCSAPSRPMRRQTSSARTTRGWGKLCAPRVGDHAASEDPKRGRRTSSIRACSHCCWSRSRLALTISAPRPRWAWLGPGAICAFGWRRSSECLRLPCPWSGFCSATRWPAAWAVTRIWSPAWCCVSPGSMPLSRTSAPGALLRTARRNRQPRACAAWSFSPLHSASTTWPSGSPSAPPMSMSSWPRPSSAS